MISDEILKHAVDAITAADRPFILAAGLPVTILGLTTELLAAREALRFYADKNSWEYSDSGVKCVYDDVSAADWDAGNLARACLPEHTKEEDDG